MKILFLLLLFGIALGATVAIQVEPVPYTQEWEPENYAVLQTRFCDKYYSFIVTDPLSVTVTVDTYSYIPTEQYSNGTTSTAILLALRVQVPVGTGNITVRYSTTNEIFVDMIPYTCIAFLNPYITPVGFLTQQTRTQYPYLYEFKVNNNVLKGSLALYLSNITTPAWDVDVIQFSYNTFFLRLYPYPSSNLSPENYTFNPLLGTVFNDTNYGKYLEVDIPFPNYTYSYHNFQCSGTTPTRTFWVWCKLDVLKDDPLNPLLIIYFHSSPSSVFSPVYGNPNNQTYFFLLPTGGASAANTNISIYSQQSTIHKLEVSTLTSIETPTPYMVNFTPQQYIIGRPPPNLLGGCIFVNVEARSAIDSLSYSMFQNFYPWPLQSYFGTNTLTYAPMFFLDDNVFGYQSGTYEDHSKSATILTSKYESRAQVQYVFQGSSQLLSTPTPYTQDTKAPIITNYQLIPVPGNNRYIILRVSIVDDDSGFARLFNADSDNNPFIITSENLIQGTPLDGTYEVVIDNPIFFYYSFVVTDHASNANSYGLGIATNMISKMLPLSNPADYYLIPDQFEILSVHWSHNDINVTDTSYYTKFMISFADPNKDFSPVFRFDLDYYPNIEDYTFYCVWNETSKHYETLVKIPMRMYTGQLSYKINWSKPISSSQLSASFPSSILRIFSEQADMFGPIIEDLKYFPAEPTPIIPIGNSGPTNIGWTFKIYDYLNGFQSGNITVIGSGDRVERVFILDPTKQTQTINITIQPTCKSQSFVIVSAYLRDKGGYVSKMEGAFMNYLDQSYQVLNTSCSPIVDENPPTLKYYSFIQGTNEIDVGAKNRLFNLDFRTEDFESGIFIEKVPVVYLTSIDRIIKQKATLVNSSFTDANYTCSFQLPYGFGFPEFVAISLYGIMDNNLNFIGYSAMDLSDLAQGYRFGIDTTIFSTDTDVEIESTGDITMNGGELLIIGKSFGLDNATIIKINYNDGQGYSQTSTPSFFSATTLIINNVKPLTKPFKIQISKRNGQYLSNEYTVYPKLAPVFPPEPNYSSSSSSSSSSPSSSSSSTELPTQAPNQCKNDCGGPLQGVCSVTGCICTSPWMGIDCTSKVIIIPTPTINETIPSTNISIPTDKNEKIAYSGLISVVELQELDVNGTMISRYPFNMWVWSNISTANEPIKYLYSTTIQNESKTAINVTIQYFEHEENVTFANQVLNMNPYSIKYSINISVYDFQNSLNTLQLVMKVGLEADQNQQGCSFIEQGNTTMTNSEYVKLQVNDHSLYGRFIKRGIIDGRISSVSNQFIKQGESVTNQYNNIHSYIGISIRSYKKLVQLDPDFSVLIDQRPASSDSNALCFAKDKSKLSKAQIAGIVIGSVGFACIIVISAIYYIVKKKKMKIFERKLHSLNKENKTNLK